MTPTTPSNLQLVTTAVHNGIDNSVSEQVVESTPEVGSSESGNLKLILPPIHSTLDKNGNQAEASTDSNKFVIPRPKIVLDEDTYVNALGNIIARDYFPRADPYGVAGIAAPNQSLTQFQTSHTSEDNNSFNRILEKDVQQARNKAPWFWNKKKPIQKAITNGAVTESQKLLTSSPITKQLDGQKSLIPQSNDKTTKPTVNQKNTNISRVLGWKDTRPKELEAWGSKSQIQNPRNALMFCPDTYGVGLTPKQIEDQSFKIINNENTRFDYQKSYDETDQTTLSNTNNTSKLTVDTRMIVDDDSKPLVNGYSFVTTETFEVPNVAESTAEQEEPEKYQFSMKGPSSTELLHEKLLQKKVLMRQRSKHGIALKHPSSNQSSLPQTPSAFNKSVKRISTAESRQKKNLSPMASSLLASLSNGARVSRKNSLQKSASTFNISRSSHGKRRL